MKLTWYQTLVLIAAGGMAVGALLTVIDLLKAISRQLQGVQAALGDIQNRLARTSDMLFQIEWHTRRSAIGKPIPDDGDEQDD